MIDLQDYLCEANCEPEVKVLQNKRTFFDFRGCNVRDFEFMKTPETFAETTTESIHIWIEKTTLGKELKKLTTQAKKDKGYKEFLEKFINDACIKDLYKLIPIIHEIIFQYDGYMICVYSNGVVYIKNPRGKDLFDHKFNDFK